jgi:DNA polymerase-4
MNSYFASVEQQLHPELRGKPIAVVPLDVDTTSCIAASYEAKAFGVRTGTKVGDAKRMCPGLLLVKGRPESYVEYHHKVLEAVDSVLPVTSVHSIDEASCRLVGVQRRSEAALDLARRVKLAVRDRCGTELRCSIGIGPNRFIAKIAADMHKPDGLTLVEKHELPARLFGLKLIDLPGIGVKMLERLRVAGIDSIESLAALDETGLGRKWGSVIGREWYYRLRGEDLREEATTRRTIGHSHVLGPDHRPEERARAVAVRLLTKLGQRARHLGYIADQLTLSVRFFTPRSRERGTPSTQKWHGRAALGGACDTTTLLRALGPLWESKPPGPILKIGVTLHDLTPAASAGAPLFEQQEGLGRLSKAMDAINKKFGVDTVYPAAMHNARKSAPRRIAFGNIPDLELPDVGG